MDALKNALLQATVTEDSNIAVKAEDVQTNNGIDFKKHFFEPQVGKSYLIKFLPNPGDEPIIHRSLYKNLPDPERKGKTFHYVSSGNAKTCKALELFFELNALKKDGDAIAEKKIKEYLGKTNQACCKVQVLQSPDPAEVGIVRMFTFATFGPNATVANLINQKVNPTKEQIAQGYEKEDIFNIFGSDVMSLVCEEATYDGIKGRDFSKSSWLPKKQRGAIGIIEKDGKTTTHEFTKADLVNGALTEAAEPFFNAFAEVVTSPDYSIYNFFAYKEIGDPRNTKETEDYLKTVQAKVDEIIPVIREKGIIEIKAYGKAEAAPSADNKEKKDKAKNVLADSIPEELADSIMSEKKDKEATDKTTGTATVADEVADIIGA